MKKLILILAMLPIMAIGQIKYDCYKFADKAELIQQLTDDGYSWEGELTQGQLTDTVAGEFLDYYYIGHIVLNYPVTYEEDDEWEAQYSTEVFIHSARKGNIKLPSNKKVTGNQRKYVNQYITCFLGEPKL